MGVGRVVGAGVGRVVVGGVKVVVVGGSVVVVVAAGGGVGGGVAVLPTTLSQTAFVVRSWP